MSHMTESTEIKEKKGIKRFFGNIAAMVVKSISRFFATFCLILGLFFVTAYLTAADSRHWFDFDTVIPHFVVLERIILVLLFGILFCTFGTIISEKFELKIKHSKILVNAVLLVLSGLAYIPITLLNIDFSLFGQANMYANYGYIGIMIALTICIFYFSIKESISKTFSYMFKGIMFNTLICGIVFAGVAICTYAFATLILDISMWNTWVSRVSSIAYQFIWIVIFMNLTLAVIPSKDTVLATPKAFKVVVLYAMLPVYLLLLTILCGYLVRILITQDFPAGQINPFVSFASLLFIFFNLSLEQYRKENKFADLFVRFAGYVLIPIIAMQFWAIHIRVSAYGLTSARYISIVMNIIALTFVVVSLIKKGSFVKYVLPIAAGTALLLTLTPLNIIDVPVRNQTARLIGILNENNMLDDGIVVPNNEISVEDKINITSAFVYIARSNAAMPDFISEIDNGKTFEEVFGFEREFERRRSPQTMEWGRIGCDCHTESGIDVTGFSRFYTIRGSGDGTVNIEVSGETIYYDIYDYVVNIHNTHGLNYHGKIVIDIGSNRLIVTRVSYSIHLFNNNLLVINSFAAYLLVAED